MAVYSYRTLTDGGSPASGTIAADTARAARDLLRARGLVIESLTPADDSSSKLRLPTRPGKRHAAKRVAMVRELSTLLAAGIPLLDAIESLVAQATGSFQSTLMTLRDRIAAGGSLAEAMSEQPQVFDQLSIHMVEVGENSGTLDVVLDQLADFSERYLQLKDRVTNALFYPVIVFMMSFGVGTFLMTVVVPMLLDNLLEAGKSIPWPTQVLKAMSDFVRGHGLELMGLSALVVVAIIVALKTNSGRRIWHKTLLQLPLVGNMARKQELARLAPITGTLLKSHVDRPHVNTGKPSRWMRISV